MAGSKSTQTKAKRQPSRNTAAEKRAERVAAQKQVAAIILFCISAFLICVISANVYHSITKINFKK